MLHPLKNWLSRHRSPVNFWLHMLGIPATVAGVGLAVAGYRVLGAGVRKDRQPRRHDRPNRQ